jgi:SAM-dependent methyltransferase
MDLKESGVLGDRAQGHWYYRSKARAMARLLGGRAPRAVLDVGAGSGFFSRYLLRHTGAAQAWCVDTGYDADSDRLEAGKPIHFRRSVAAVDTDVVLLMDVLEHVDDDVALLREYAGKVPSGSRFLVTVPAFRFLWSGHDDFLGHKRRYTLGQLETTVRSAGLQVERGGYYFGIVFPLAAALRLVRRLVPDGRPAHSDLRVHPPMVNWLLAGLCAMELPLMRFNRAAGLTAYCLAGKP